MRNGRPQLCCALLLASACAPSWYWAHPTKTWQDLNKDEAQCAVQANQATMGSPDPFGGLYGRVFEMCMTGEGWTQQTAK